MNHDETTSMTLLERRQQALKRFLDAAGLPAADEESPVFHLTDENPNSPLELTLHRYVLSLMPSRRHEEPMLVDHFATLDDVRRVLATIMTDCDDLSFPADVYDLDTDTYLFIDVAVTFRPLPLTDDGPVL